MLLRTPMRMTGGCAESTGPGCARVWGAGVGSCSAQKAHGKAAEAAAEQSPQVDVAGRSRNRGLASRDPVVVHHGQRLAARTTGPARRRLAAAAPPRSAGQSRRSQLPPLLALSFADPLHAGSRPALAFWWPGAVCWRWRPGHARSAGDERARHSQQLLFRRSCFKLGPECMLSGARRLDAQAAPAPFLSEPGRPSTG